MRMWGFAALLLAGGCATTGQVTCPAPRLERFVAMAALGPDRLLVALGPVRLSAEDVDCLARTGDKQAQYELARRLETADGVPADLERAEALYRAAATTIVGTTAIYVPPACLKCAGSVQFIRTGPDRPGLPQAELALAVMHIEGRAAAPDYKRGVKRLDKLARRGFPPAVAYQARLRSRKT